MRPNSLSRRNFLRVGGTGLAAAILAACRPSATPDLQLTMEEKPTLPPAPSQEPTNPPQPAPSATASPAGAKISLNGKDADVWAGEVRVSGKVLGIEACQAVWIDANGVRVEAQVEGDTFTAVVPVEPGLNRVRAECQNSEGWRIASEPVVYTERLVRKPRAVIKVSWVEGTLQLDASQSQRAEPEVLLVDHLWAASAKNPAPVMIKGASGLPDRPLEGQVSAESLLLALPEVDGEYYFSMQVADDAGREDSAATYVVVENGQVRIPDYAHENTAWVENAIVYGIIPRLFGSRGFHSIAERLDYLKDLGVNAVWLAPVFVSPPGDYGYAVKDYFSLSASYGSKEDFHRMVEEAHARGIRVLMDFVPNHSSVQHPYFRQAAEEGPVSHYWTFYDRDENGQPTHYFSWTHLPNLNYANPEVRNWMLEAFSYWIREFDVDGYRVDACWGVQQRQPDFWPAWRDELKRIKPDLLLLAEASARDPYWFDNGFDAAYDWTGALGKWAWEGAWGTYKNQALIYNLDSALTNRPQGYHPDALIFRFLNNNDTGKRYITRYGEPQTRAAAALMLTLPGIPCVYTGDEIGAEYEPYTEPPALDWEEKFNGLRGYYRKLITLRKALPSLHSRLWTSLDIKPTPQEVYAYLRYGPENSQPVLAAMNFFENDSEVEIAVPETFQAALHGGQWYDFLAERPVNVAVSGGVLKLPVRGYEARILAPEDWRKGQR